MQRGKARIGDEGMHVSLSRVIFPYKTWIEISRKKGTVAFGTKWQINMFTMVSSDIGLMENKVTVFGPGF